MTLRAPPMQRAGHAAAAPADAARALAEPGTPLPAPLLRDMEERFGHDFSRVAAHAGPLAARAALEVQAHAYASGRHIVFGAGRYAPHTGAGRDLIAHELSHVVERGGLQVAATVHCQAAAVPTAAPTSIDGAIDMVAAAQAKHFATPSDTPAALAMLDQTAAYLNGAVSDARIDKQLRYIGMAFTAVATALRVVRAAPAGLASELRRGVKVDVRRWEGNLNMLRGVRETMQLVTGERFPEQSQFYYQGPWASDAEEADHELATRFNADVHSASLGTGPLGITPRMLAAVLRTEIQNTAAIPIPYRSPADARASEIAGVQSSLDQAAAGAVVDPKDIDHSVGVGQVKLSTAAALAGKIPWRESDRSNRAAVRAQTTRDFAAVGVSTKQALLRLLSKPRSNIVVAASLLARLKNRPHRYRAMPRADFGANQAAVALTATEYNIGPSATPLADAKPTEYGTTVWTDMQSDVMQRNFTDT